MKKIPLTQGMFALVDDEDYEYLIQWKWQSDGRYAFRRVMVSSETYLVRMHNIIAGFIPRDNIVVDHINGNSLDNRKLNIRLCTKQQNLMNKRKYKNNITGFKGVRKEERKHKDGSTYICFRARFIKNKKEYTSSTYFTLEEAARAYDEMAKEYFGEFACLNFPCGNTNSRA